MDFNLGDVVIHKATRKRCVVKDFEPDGDVVVTTSDDDLRVYKPHELEKSEK